MVADEGDAATEPLPLIGGGELLRAAALSPPWSMVAIRSHQKHDRDNPPVVFPPVDHENLHISREDLKFHEIHAIHAGNLQISFSDSDSDSDLNSSSTFSPSDSSPPPRSPIAPAKKKATDGARKLDSWTGMLNSKANALVRFLCSALASTRGALLTYRFAAFAAVLAAFLYFRRRRRLRGGEESRDRLIAMIKQRDEKINLLLDQISRMNQMLLAKHKSPTI